MNFVQDTALLCATLTDSVRCAIINAFLADNGLARHQLESYDRAMEELLRQIILGEKNVIKAESKAPLNHHHEIEIVNYRIIPPTLKEVDGKIHPTYPSECKMRNATYAHTIVCDIEHKIFTNEYAHSIAHHTSDHSNIQQDNDDCNEEDEDENEDVDDPTLEVEHQEETRNNILIGVHRYYNVFLAEVPCMLRSKWCRLKDSPYLYDECPLNPGGEFILDGSRKVLCTQDTLRSNYPFIFVKKKEPKFSHVCEIRSRHEDKFRSTSTMTLHITRFRGDKNMPMIFVLPPYIQDKMPLPLLIRLLLPKCCTFNEMLTSLMYSARNCNEVDNVSGLTFAQIYEQVKKCLYNVLVAMDADSYLDLSYEDALDQMSLLLKPNPHIHSLQLGQNNANQIKQLKRKQAENIIYNEVLPHMGLERNDETKYSKFCFLAYSIRKLVSVCLGILQPDDQDDYTFKRVMCPGFIIASSFRTHFRNVMKNARGQIKKRLDTLVDYYVSVKNSGNDPLLHYTPSSILNFYVFNFDITKYMRFYRITEALNKHMKTGNFNTQQTGIQSTNADSINHAAKISINSMSNSSEQSSFNSNIQVGSNTTQTSVIGLNRQHAPMTSVGLISNLRIIVTHMNKQGKMIAPRLLHPSHFGFICASEASEGESCGLAKHMSISCIIRVGYHSSLIVDLISDPYCIERKRDVNTPRIIASLKEVHLSHKCSMIFLNGVILGFLMIPLMEYVQILKNFRRTGKLPILTSISHDECNVYVTCDHGTPMRPVFRLDKMKEIAQILYPIQKECHTEDFKFILTPNIQKAWRKLLEHNCIEYISKDEEKNIVIACWNHDVLNECWKNCITPWYFRHATQEMQEDWAQRYVPYQGKILKNELPQNSSASLIHYLKSVKKNCSFTHMELDAQACTLGIVAGSQVFSNQNNGTRTILPTSMYKQANAIFATNQLSLIDKTMSLLTYPQKPLVRTTVDRLPQTIPAGFNSLVVIGSFHGYDMDDATVANKASIERGQGRSYQVKYYSDTDNVNSQYQSNNTGEVTKFCNPIYHKINQNCNYKSLDDEERCVPKLGKFVDKQDVIIGKVRQKKKTNEVTHDMSTVIQTTNEYGRVIRVVTTTNPKTGNRIKRVGVGKMHLPEAGDKVCSRHGQKNVQSILCAEEDLPFGYNGMIPSFMVNPHGHPSRMTGGEIVEYVAALASGASGRYVDGTPYRFDVSRQDMKHLEKILCHTYGMVKCRMPMRCGMTGRLYDIPFFVGTKYMLWLRQQVESKMHAHGKGKKQSFNRQPTQGRREDGGYKWGEQERSNSAAHGAAAFLDEKMRVLSDGHRTFVCRTCANIAIPPIMDHNAPQELRAQFADKPYCLRCHRFGIAHTIETVDSSYGFQLTQREVAGMHLSLNTVYKDV